MMSLMLNRPADQTHVHGKLHAKFDDMSWRKLFGQWPLIRWFLEVPRSGMNWFIDLTRELEAQLSRNPPYDIAQNSGSLLPNQEHQRSWHRDRNVMRSLSSPIQGSSVDRSFADSNHRVFLSNIFFSFPSSPTLRNLTIQSNNCHLLTLS